MSVWDDIGSVFTGPATAVSDITDFLKWAAWLVNPFNWLRAVEFWIGIFMMFFGGWMLVTSGRTGISQSGIARVTRQLASATPAGREYRMARGRVAGTREGEIEHARLEARRASRQREAQRTQRRGSNRHERQRSRRPA